MTEAAAPLLTGLVAATFTPMNVDGAIDLQRIAAVCDFVLEQGVDGLFVCGSTGESPSLTIDERMVVAETYIESWRLMPSNWSPMPSQWFPPLTIR